MLTDVKEHDIIKLHRAEKAKKRWEKTKIKNFKKAIDKCRQLW